MNNALKQFLVAVLFLLVVSACQPTPAVNVTMARPVVVPTQVFVVVSSTPRPTITPTPAPTLAFDAARYEGHWSLNFSYRIYNGVYWSDIRYNGGMDVDVSPVGKISGTATLFTLMQQIPCQAFVKENNGLEFQIEGELGAPILNSLTTSSGGEAVGTIRIIPRNPNVKQAFILVCYDADRSLNEPTSLLWPALAATDQLNLQLTFTPGAVTTSLRNLYSASGGRLFGTLATEIRLNR